MMRRLRLILPPDWTIIAFVLIFVLTEGPIYYVEQKFGQPVAGIHPGIILARIAAFAFGLFRVRSFHPALNPEYRSWLERTPWTIRKPLPGGPVTLVWGDILVLGGLAASVAAWGLPEVLAVLSLALIGYLCGLTIALRDRRPIVEIRGRILDRSGRLLLARSPGLSGRLDRGIPRRLGRAPAIAREVPLATLADRRDNPG